MGDLMAFWALILAIITISLITFNRAGYEFKTIDYVMMCLIGTAGLFACYGIGYFIGTVF